MLISAALINWNLPIYLVACDCVGYTKLSSSALDKIKPSKLVRAVTACNLNKY